MIDSLLHLEIMDLKDEKALEILKETRTRLRSMAGIYEILYKNSGGDKVDFRQYVGNLIGYLSKTYLHSDSGIGFSVHIDDFSVDLKNAVPLALILNELITNAMKYAFPNGASGEIRIEAKKYAEDQIEIIVADDGIGLPADFDVEKASSLGFKLVYLLAKQLRGVIFTGKNVPRGALIVLKLGSLDR